MELIRCKHAITSISNGHVNLNSKSFHNKKSYNHLCMIPIYISSNTSEFLNILQAFDRELLSVDHVIDSKFSHSLCHYYEPPSEQERTGRIHINIRKLTKVTFLKQ